jgi:hypothetical protein
MSAAARTTFQHLVRNAAGWAICCLAVSCGDSTTNSAGAGGAASASAGAAGATAGGAPTAAGGSPASTGGGAPVAGASPSAGNGTAGMPDTTSAGMNAGGSGASAGAANGGAPNGATIVPDPSWTCGKADGLVDPTLGQLVFTASISVGQVRHVGATQFGDRSVSDLTGGTITGNKLEATVLPGGIDFELQLSNGATELEQVTMLRAKDNSLIYLRTCGVAPAGETVVRIVPDFEVATSSALSWLNTGNFVGTRKLDAAGKQLELSVYDVSAVKADGAKVQLKDPAGVPNQPWDCVKATGAKGSEVFTESVTLGGSLSVGASKRGTRNVIPITGGTVTGKLTGTIVNAGADYQLLGGSTTLDARYVLTANDGEVVVVRNCGPFGALIPLFEARSAGPYAFLNSGKFISSDPGSAAGGVKITFYELN